MKKLILLPLALILFAAPMADNLLTEGFEGGSLPGGWDIWQEGDPGYYGYTWSVAPFYPHTGSYGVYHYWDYGDLDNWLVTPTLDVSAYENLSLTIWHMGAYPGDYTGSYIMASDIASPNAGDFTELDEIGAPPGSWTELTVDASAYDGESDVTFAFSYTGDYGHNIFMDDVSVDADPVAAVESASLGEIKAIYR